MAPRLTRANFGEVRLLKARGDGDMIEIRKIITTGETVFSELGVEASDRPLGLWAWQ
jgi:hypothetical protein